MAKNVTLTLGQFLLLGETQSKILVSQGYQINIVNDVNNSIEDRKPTSFSKTETKPATHSKSETTKTTKGSSKSKSPKGETLKAGDYFKVVNASNGKLVSVGKVKSVDSDQNGKWVHVEDPNVVYKLERCVKINDITFGKLQSRLAKKLIKKTSSTKRLAPLDYKIAYAFNLLKLGKITDEEFAKAKTVKEFADQLYITNKADVVLKNEDALKLHSELNANA